MGPGRAEATALRQGLPARYDRTRLRGMWRSRPGSAFILWRSGTGAMWHSHLGLRIRFHFMESRNWGYVAQDCGSAFILWRSGTGAIGRSHPGLRIRFHFMEIRIHFMEIRIHFMEIRIHFMEIRNWGYVAQSPRIADLHSFNGIWGRVLDPHWFQCGSGSSFLSHADPHE